MNDIALRPVTQDDIPMLEALTGDREMTGEFGWFGWRSGLHWRRQWDEDRLLGEDGGVLVVVREDQPLGLVNWRKQRTTPGAFCWEIGIAMLPAARGHGYGWRAQQLLARYLFAHTTAHRVFAATDADNVAEQRALEKAGFTREGTLRGVGWRDGAWRDGVQYSILRTDILRTGPSV